MRCAMVEPLESRHVLAASGPYAAASSHAEQIPARGTKPAKDMQVPTWGDRILDVLQRVGWAIEGVFFGAIGVALAPFTIPGLLLLKSAYRDVREHATDNIAKLAQREIPAVKEFEKTFGMPLKDILKNMDDKQLAKLQEEPRFQKFMKSLDKADKEEMEKALIGPVIKLVVGALLAAPLLVSADLFSKAIHGPPPVAEELQKELRDFIDSAYEFKRKDQPERSYLTDSLGQTRYMIGLEPSDSQENSELTRIRYQDYKNLPASQLAQDLDYAINTINKGLTQEVNWGNRQFQKMPEDLRHLQKHLNELKAKLPKD